MRAYAMLGPTPTPRPEWLNGKFAWRVQQATQCIGIS